MPELGKRVWSQNIVLSGRMTEDDWRAFLLEAISAMGMSASGEAACWRYPTENGKGGLGMTICQPMTESFMVIDTWDAHDGAYLHISSCQRFNSADLTVPAQTFGLGIDLMGAAETLRL